MRFLLILLLTAIGSYCAILFFPWWIRMVISFAAVLLLPLSGGKAFLAAALGAALAYTVLSARADIANEHILSAKMAALFQLPSYGWMIAVTALVGAITAGLGAWLASALLLLFKKKNIQAY